MTELSHTNREKLPEQWQIAYFGNLVKFSMGKTPPRKNKEYWDDGKYAWVSISDMIPYGIIFDTAEKVSEIAHENVFRRKLIPPGYILMSFKLTIGRVSKIGIPAYHNEAIISFRPDNPLIFEDYLFFFLSQINYLNYQDKAIKGNTLNKSKIAKLEIAFPPLSEQRRIAAILTAVQRAIEQQERLIALTAELKKTLMQKLFTEGTRGERQKMTEIGPVPESWEVIKLKSLIREDLRNGHSAKATNDNVGIRTLTLTAVTKNDFSEQNTKITSAEPIRVKDMWLRSGDILIERANTLEYVGLAALYEGPGNYAIFPDLMVRVRVDEKKILPKVMADYLIIDSCRSYFRLNAKGTAGNFPKIDQGIISALNVPLPPFEDQKIIENTSRRIDEKIELHQQFLKILQDLFRTLLHQLMTAQIRVNEVDLSELKGIGIEVD